MPETPGDALDPRRVTLLDACVLVPITLCDTILRLAEWGLFTPAWSALILTEAERTLVNEMKLPAAHARKRIEDMDRAFPGARVAGF